MKKTLRTIIAATLLCITCHATAQQVTTLYFLENAPMRHTLNPAFQPVSNGYLNFTPVGYMSMWGGNNSLTMSDLIYKDKQTGNTITALHPNGDKAALLNTLQQVTFINGGLDLNLLSFGFRVKESGYFHFNALERIDAGIGTPHELYEILLGGGMQDLNGGVNRIDLSRLSLNADIYTEVGFGYSQRINESWTIGGKMKFLMGTAAAKIKSTNLGIDASAEEWRINGQGDLLVAGPLQWDKMPQDIEGIGQIGSDIVDLNDIPYLVKPSGYGAAIDFGFVYKPIEQFQITASLSDLGFICWTNAHNYHFNIDTTFAGAGELQYADYVVNGEFSTDSMMSDVKNSMLNVLDAMHMTDMGGKTFTRMVNGKFNIAIDAKFLENRLGLGVIATTRLYRGRLYGEATIGAALRPCNWLNLALTYSLLNNGKYSNIGAGLSFMPYDGINMTLAMDYIPTTYAYYDNIPVPYRSRGFNMALGFSIVWGTNHKQKTKDVAPTDL